MKQDAERAEEVIEILQADPIRWHLLEVVAGLGLPDCWIAAGFVRNAVWDRLHGLVPQPLQGDVDVIWFDPAQGNETVDRSMEAILSAEEPSVQWSVKNQARMHQRNGDAAYKSASDAMRFWPESATAVAARLDGNGKCEISSPLGLDDLFELLVRPVGRFRDEKRAVFETRLESKAWMEIWPKLILAET